MDLNQEQLKAIQELNNHWQETSDQSKEGLFNFLIGSGLEPNQTNRPVILAFFQDNDIQPAFYTSYNIYFNERQQQKAENRKRLTIDRKLSELKQNIIDFEKNRDTATDTDIQNHIQKSSGLLDEIKKTANSKPGNTLEYLTFADIINEPRKFEAVIQGMFNADDKVVLHASGGVGKSLFTTYMALCLAARDNLKTDNTWPKFLDTFAMPKQVSTLFIQNENSRTALFFRTNSMCEGDPRLKTGVKNLYCPVVSDDVCLYGKSLEDDEFCNWIVDLARHIERQEKTKIGLIVLDPLISFRDGDENDNTLTRNALDRFTDVARRVGAVPLVVHHDNKQGNSRGASAVHDWARSRIQLKYKDQANGVITLSHEKASNTRLFKEIDLMIDEHMIFRPHDKKAQELAEKTESDDFFNTDHFIQNMEEVK